MLKHIPFYASLLDRQLANNRKATQGVVLLYGAIEVHDMGERGCIASNDTLAKETGLSKASIASYLSTMNKSGWIQVNVNPETNHRTDIKPLLVIADPLTGVNRPFYGGKTPPLTGVKHRYIKEDNKNNTLVRKEKTEAKYSKDDIRLTDSLFLTVAKLFPNHKQLVNRKPTDKDYLELNKLHRIDGYEYKLIEDVMKWLFTGYKPSETFDWKDQIKSPYKLRKHFVNLSTQYEKAKKSGQYRPVTYDTRPPDERHKAPVFKPKEEHIHISPEDAEKNKVILNLVRAKKVNFSEMKMLKSKTIEELRDMLNPV